jgi:transaldolase
MVQPTRNPLLALQDYGQSFWLDFIRRKALQSGEVGQLVERDGLRGMTANPTIFEQAISAGDDYDDTIERLIRENAEPTAIFDELAAEDIRSACDLFRPVYETTGGADGFVSLEVFPSLAHDTNGTIQEAHRLWQMVDRPNLMIKVPGTAAGVPAVEQLLADGLNINITLLFSLQSYERVAWAYIAALERRVREDKPIDRIASVASFFVSRVDTLVDEQIQRRLQPVTDSQQRAQLEALLGKLGIANARLAYQSFKRIFADERFRRLQERDARVQRPLWASTSVKNPNYPELMYVENLIGPDTVDTMPRETVDAFRDHGQPRHSIEEDVDGAHTTMNMLDEVGIDYDAVTAQLEDQGVAKFAKSYDSLIEGIARKREQLLERQPQAARVS